MADTLNSVAKALDVLGVLRERGPLKLADIAEATGVGTSTAHRIVSTLRAQRFVRQEFGGKRYELGPAMLYTSSVSALEHCVTVSEPVMHDLQRETEETVHLSVLRGRRCLFAASVESRRLVRVTSRVGQGPPAHTAAGGKVLLAALDAERRAALFRGEPLLAPTPAAITDEHALNAELDAVRAQGWARNRGESESDMYALAVPLHRPNGDVVSSLTVAAPLSRMPVGQAGLSPHEEHLLQQLRQAATQIESLLAY